MKKILSFSRSALSGTIVNYTGYKPFGEIPIKDIKIKECSSKDSIDAFLEKMDFFFYMTNEIDNLYFFYKKQDELRAVRYSIYFGMTEITDILVEENLTACHWGMVQIFTTDILC